MISKLEDDFTTAKVGEGCLRLLDSIGSQKKDALILMSHTIIYQRLRSIFNIFFRQPEGCVCYHGFLSASLEQPGRGGGCLADLEETGYFNQFIMTGLLMPIS